MDGLIALAGIAGGLYLAYAYQPVLGWHLPIVAVVGGVIAYALRGFIKGLLALAALGFVAWLFLADHSKSGSGWPAWTTSLSGKWADDETHMRSSARYTLSDCPQGWNWAIEGDVLRLTTHEGSVHVADIVSHDTNEIVMRYRQDEARYVLTMSPDGNTLMFSLPGKAEPFAYSKRCS